MAPFTPNEAQKPSPASNNSIGASSALPQLDVPLPRGRLSSRTPSDFKSPTSGTPPMPRRRSSILSFSSLDDTRHSARDFIRPGLGLNNNDNVQDEEPSNWHSSPLAFAFLPALAGLFFTNGSAFVTDILLLGLAALFLNWSVRLPWYAVSCRFVLLNIAKNCQGLVPFGTNRCHPLSIASLFSDTRRCW